MDHINRIVVDSRGFVWFCTMEGLSRFDGYRLISFGTGEGLPHGTVETLLEARSGAYLVGTARGLCQFHAGSGGNRFTTNRPGKSDGANAVSALPEASSGGIWCGTAGGLFEAPRDFQFQRWPLPGSSHPASRKSSRIPARSCGWLRNPGSMSSGKTRDRERHESRWLAASVCEHVVAGQK
jgi:ligand-binding sensor domain-containing protein